MNTVCMARYVLFVANVYLLNAVVCSLWTHILPCKAAPVMFGVPGSLNALTAAYMNRDDVKEALHVTSSPMQQWPGPTSDWSYHSDYAACNFHYPPGTPSMVEFYQVRGITALTANLFLQNVTMQWNGWYS